LSKHINIRKHEKKLTSLDISANVIIYCFYANPSCKKSLKFEQAYKNMNSTHENSSPGFSFPALTQSLIVSSVTLATKSHLNSAWRDICGLGMATQSPTAIGSTKNPTN
jgi:hypothetical protein